MSHDDTFTEITGHLPAPYITCPVCMRTSYNASDIQEGYCGNCHEWTGLPPVVEKPWTAK